MLGLGLTLWIIYIIGFIALHTKDVKPMNENSWYGESRYDSQWLSDSWRMDWQNQYAMNVLMDSGNYLKALLDENLDECLDLSLEHEKVRNMGKEEALSYANIIAKREKLSNERLKQLKDEAIEAAKNAKVDIWDTITNDRKSCFESDLHNNMKWCAVAVLVLTILGRYFIVFGKWVARNKTSDED